MKSVRVLAKRPAAKASGKASYSTSQGRANLARALETAGAKHAIVGFDRYGHPIAALVSIDAVRLIAGQEDVDPQVRTRIVRMAQVFLSRLRSDGAGRAARKRRSAPKVSQKKTPARRKTTKAKRRPRRKGLGKSG